MSPGNRVRISDNKYKEYIKPLKVISTDIT